MWMHGGGSYVILLGRGKFAHKRDRSCSLQSTCRSRGGQPPPGGRGQGPWHPLDAGWGAAGAGGGALRGLGVPAEQEAPSSRTSAQCLRVSLRASPSQWSSDAGTVFHHLRSEGF